MIETQIGLFDSVSDGSWCLCRKARELIDRHQVLPSELYFVVDTPRMLRVIANVLSTHKIPFRKMEKTGPRGRETSVVATTEELSESWTRTYWFFLLARQLGEKRGLLLRLLTGQEVGEAYFAVCHDAKEEGDELSLLLNAELTAAADWRNPGTVYYPKEEGRWTAHWADTPRWMVSELPLRIADELAERQEEFLEMGFGAMKPLNMKEVALAVGCHESSVSRVVAGVDAETPWGRVSLKSLFSRKLHSRDKPASQTSVKAILLQLVESEDKDKPFSDEELSNRLGQMGIKVSRRTIAKYRESLHVPSSNVRRNP